jgi:hypothetical protein
VLVGEILVSLEVRREDDWTSRWKWARRTGYSSPGEIKKLKNTGDDIYDLKEGAGSLAHSDLYKTPNRDIVVKPKGFAGERDPTTINIQDVGRETPDKDE